MDTDGRQELTKEQNHAQPREEKYRDKRTFICSVRWRMCYYLFVAYFLLYAHRVNLSLAIVCMVNTQEVESTLTYSNYTASNHTPPLFKERRGTSNWTTDKVTSNDSKIMDRYIAAFDDVTVDENQTSSGEVINSPNVVGRCMSNYETTQEEWTPELHWTKTEISFLLSSYFYGSFFTQIPAGTLSDIFGGKHILTAAMLVSAICSLLTPVCARADIAWVFALRIVIGLAGGTVIPAGMSFITSWAPPKELTSMLTFVGLGLLSGAIVTYMTSGLLCAYGFDNGWPTIFYLHGALTLLFTAIWVLDGYSVPRQHPRMSDEELQYINNGRPAVVNRRNRVTPWRSMLTSRPLWACFTAHFCYNWSFFTIIINIPLFLKEVLKFDVKSNGVYSALPLMLQMISSLTLTRVAIFLIRKRILGHLATRRLFNTLCLLGCGVCLVGTGYVTCEVRHVGVVLLCTCCVFGGLVYAGFLVNHPEFGGQYSGTLLGITNAGGVISSTLASMLAGLLTPHGLQAEWQVVFYIAAALNVFGALVFLFFSDVHLQDWARPESGLHNGDKEMQSVNNMTIIVREK